MIPIARTTVLASVLLLVPGTVSGQQTPIGNPGHGDDVGFSNAFAPVWSTRIYTNDFMAFHPRDHGRCTVDGDRGATYCGTRSGRVIAARQDDGAILWRFSTKGAVRTRPTLGEEGLFAGSSDGCLYRLDPRTGTAQWKAPFCTDAAVYGDPAMAGDLVLFSVTINKVYAVSAADATFAWEFHRDRPQFMNAEGIASPVVDGDRVYIGFSDGAFAAIDTRTGKPAWLVSLAEGRQTDVDATAVVDGGMVYTGSFAQGPVALQASDGVVRWKGRWFGVSRPLLTGGMVVVGTADGEVVGLKRENGETVFVTHLRDTAASTPIRAGGLLVVAGEHGLWGLTPEDGSPVGLLWMPMGVHEAPAVSGSRLFFMGGGGFVHAVDVRRNCSSWLGIGAVCP